MLQVTLSLFFMSLGVVGYSVSGMLGTRYVCETFNETFQINYHLVEGILRLLFYCSKIAVKGF